MGSCAHSTSWLYHGTIHSLLHHMNMPSSCHCQCCTLSSVHWPFQGSCCCCSTSRFSSYLPTSVQLVHFFSFAASGILLFVSPVYSVLYNLDFLGWSTFCALYKVDVGSFRCNCQTCWRLLATICWWILHIHQNSWSSLPAPYTSSFSILDLLPSSLAGSSA